MAAKAILRRKKFISDYVNASACSIQSFPCIGQRHTVHNFDSQSTWLGDPATCFSCVKDRDKVSVAKEGLLSLSVFGKFSYRYNRNTFSGFGNGRSGYVSLMDMGLMPQSIRNASTAAAKQPEMGSDDDENKEIVAKNRKEASPEECDQAVEGLSSAKAKVKAKRLQEPQRITKSGLHRVWATFLGIGPALRAVGSMSRLVPPNEGFIF